MTEQEKEFFNLLAKRRENRAETINDPEFKNGFENNIDKYTDQAHFVYELLQNADDAGATRVRFLLEKERLIFAHNGTKRFFVSNPDTVEVDKEAGKYGSVNSITAIGYSTKPGENAIGKFGIGFMSVFQYTKVPKIYDENICFQIERLIVPVLIPDEAELRNAGETTLFVFPFNSERCSKEEAYAEVSKKLRSLSHPLMFLNTLEKIEYQIEENHGLYQREETENDSFDDIRARRVRFSFDSVQGGDSLHSFEEFWFFSRGNEIWNRYTVCFAVEKDSSGKDKLKQFDAPAFCFFQTKSSTGLHFAIHAPFLLTDNREGIKAGNAHNKEMVSKLAALAADSLVCLRDIGMKHGIRLIDDNILNIIPTSEDSFGYVDDSDSLSYLPFFRAIREKMSTEALLPTADGYISKDNAYWPETQQIAELISQKQLAALTKNPAAQWVFSKVTRNISNRVEYVKRVVGNKCFSNATIINGWLPIRNGLPADFFQEQSIEWLNHLYKWILSVMGSVSGSAKRLKTTPLFRNRLKLAVAPYDSNGQHVLFLNGNNDDKAVCPEHLNNEDAMALLKNLDVGEVSPWDDLYNNVIRPCAAKQDGSIAKLDNFRKYFTYYCDAVKKGNTPKNLINEIKKYPCILFYTASDQHGSAVPSSLYYPNPILKDWFETKPDTMFVDLDAYAEFEDTDSLLIDFFSALGVKDSIRIRMLTLKEYGDGWNKAVSLGLHIPKSDYAITWKYPEIDGLLEILKFVSKTSDFEKSKLIWRVLVSIVEQEYPSRLDYRLQYSWTAGKTMSELSPIVRQLRSLKWLKLSDGSYVAPQLTKASFLDSEYIHDSDAVPELLRFLRIDDDLEPEENHSLTDEEKQNIEYGRIARELGYTPDEVKAILEREKQKEASYTNQGQLSKKNVNSDSSSSETENDDTRSFRNSFD